jgi:parallel beta-helix repeat protein
VRKNIVVETVGTAEGTTFPAAALGEGFFIDFGCQNSTVSDNIAARNTTQGFLMSRGRNHDVTGNLAFGNSTVGGTQINIGYCQTSPCTNSMKNNVMVSTASLEQSFFVYPLSAYTGDGNVFFDPFAAPTPDYQFNMWEPNTCSIYQGTDPTVTCYSLASWRTATGGDATSKAASFLWRDEFPSDYLSEPLVPNPTFDNGILGWEGNVTADATTVLGPGVRLDFSGTRAILLAQFAVKQGATYEIRARTLGVNAVDPWLTLSLEKHDWGSILEPMTEGVRNLPVSNKPREHAIIFKPSASDAAAWLQLETKASKTWLDDVYVRQIERYRVPRGVVLRPGDAVPKAARIVLYINPSTSPQEINLGGDTFYDLDGKAVSGTFSIAAMGGQVLIAGAKLGLGKSVRDFGSASVGTPVKQMPVLSNIGSQPLAITGATIKEPGTPFSVSNACDGKTLEVGGACAVDLVYAPTAAGDHTATLVIVSNDGQGTERDVVLKGSAR